MIPFLFGQVAQSVEQRTENPCVGGSIPSLATNLKKEAFVVKKILIALFTLFVFQKANAEIYYGGGLHYRLFDYAEKVDAPGKSTEKGFLSILGLEAQSFPNPEIPITYFVKFEISPEQSSTYDGTTQAPAFTPVTSDNKQIFIGGEILASYPILKTMTIDFGFGYSWWQRKLISGTSYKEIYSWGFLEIGMSQMLFQNSNWNVLIAGLIKPTFFNQLQVIFSETVTNGADTILSPGSKIGYRLRVPIQYQISNEQYLKFIPSIEVSGFSRSDSKFNSTLNKTIFEPESQTTQTEIYIAYIQKY